MFFRSLARRNRGNLLQPLSETRKREGKTAQDYAFFKQALEEDTALVKDLKRDCQTLARNFEVQAKDNQAELTALGKAKAILLMMFA